MYFAKWSSVINLIYSAKQLFSYIVFENEHTTMPLIFINFLMVVFQMTKIVIKYQYSSFLNIYQLAFRFWPAWLLPFQMW